MIHLKIMILIILETGDGSGICLIREGGDTHWLEKHFKTGQMYFIKRLDK